MADNKLNRGQPDRSKINLSEDYEVKYWANERGVTRKEVGKIISKVGNSAAGLRKEIDLPAVECRP
jgi:hypothetical protein